MFQTTNQLDTLQQKKYLLVRKYSFDTKGLKILVSTQWVETKIDLDICGGQVCQKQYDQYHVSKGIFSMTALGHSGFNCLPGRAGRKPQILAWLGFFYVA